MTQRPLLLQFGARRSTAAAPIILAAALLQGCIESQFPVLPDDAAIVDTSLTGHYVLDPPFAGSNSSEYDVYLKGKKYIIAQGSKLVYIGTIHPWRADSYLVQMRSAESAVKVSGYAYFLIKKTNTGVDINFIQCPESDHCDVKDNNGLSSTVSFGESHLEKKQLATATKTRELGQ